MYRYTNIIYAGNLTEINLADYRPNIGCQYLIVITIGCIPVGTHVRKTLKMTSRRQAEEFGPKTLFALF